MENTEKNEYQLLNLSEESSGAQTEGTGKSKSAEEEDLSFSMVLLGREEEREAPRPAEQASAPLGAEPTRKTEAPPSEPRPAEPAPAPEKKPLPEEPDLELLAKQIREETERENKKRARGARETKDAAAEQGDGAAKEEPTGAAEPEKPSKEAAGLRRIRGLFEYVETFCVALAVMIVLFLYVFRYVSVDGDSMLPTLHGGDSSDHADRLIISDFLYEPQTGDIVVINTGTSERPLIKRVIAAGGQTVRINFLTWEVTVDGVLLDESYIRYQEGKPMESRDMGWLYGIDENGVCEFTVREGKVFVMGDNRNNSKDSRFCEIGEQDVEHILGKVILRLYPIGEFGSV